MALLSAWCKDWVQRLWVSASIISGTWIIKYAWHTPPYPSGGDPDPTTTTGRIEHRNWTYKTLWVTLKAVWGDYALNGGLWNTGSIGVALGLAREWRGETLFMLAWFWLTKGLQSNQSLLVAYTDSQVLLQVQRNACVSSSNSAVIPTVAVKKTIQH